MKKIITVLICIIALSLLSVSCTYNDPTDTESETSAVTEGKTTEPDSQEETEDDGWDVETEESKGDSSDDETESRDADSNETERSDTEKADGESESEKESESSGNTVGGDGESNDEETYPPANNENDGLWDPDVDEY